MGKIIKMTEEDKYCVDIMQQNLAVLGLLRSAHQTLMENHLDTCFKKAMGTQNLLREPCPQCKNGLCETDAEGTCKVNET